LTEKELTSPNRRIWLTQTPQSNWDLTDQTKEEWESISSQFVMTSRAKRPKSSLPYAFTEQGVAMLSGLLNSDIAINTNILVMRAFVMIRQYALNYAELNQKIEKLSS